jgi:23S rRNA (uridine2552-2'-O)-methyltransferase
MKPSKNTWDDHYARQARKEHYAARSVYKLEEIQKKYRLIKKGDTVLDLGCAPGSWLQYTAQMVGESGRVVGIDIQPVTVRFPAQVEVITADIFQLQPTASEKLGTGFRMVLSDMAPSTSGDKRGDAARSFELSCTALTIAEEVLSPGGNFVCKIFQGEDFPHFCDLVKARYNRMQIFKPQSSRKASREIFVIGMGKK